MLLCSYVAVGVAWSKLSIVLGLVHGHVAMTPKLALPAAILLPKFQCGEESKYLSKARIRYCRAFDFHLTHRPHCPVFAVREKAKIRLETAPACLLAGVHMQYLGKIVVKYSKFPVWLRWRAYLAELLGHTNAFVLTLAALSPSNQNHVQ